MSILSICLGVEQYQNPKGTVTHSSKCQKTPDVLIRKSYQQMRDEADIRWKSIFNGGILSRKQIKEALGYKSEGGSLHIMKKRGKVAAVFDFENKYGPGKRQLFKWIGD